MHAAWEPRTARDAVTESALLHARARELGYTLDVPRIAMMFAVSPEPITGRSLRDYTACITTHLACLADQIEDS
jgi:hypothetical protein